MKYLRGILEKKKKILFVTRHNVGEGSMVPAFLCIAGDIVHWHNSLAM